jgi:HAMP domain-containing protein
MRLSLKLAAACAAVTAVPLTLASIFVLRQVSSHAGRLIIEQLESNSRAAESIYQKRLDEMSSAAQRLADEIAIHGAIESSGSARARLQDLLSRARDELSLDFLIVADPARRCLARHNDMPAAGESLSNPIAEKALSNGSRMQAFAVAGCHVESGELLARLWLDKVAQVQREDGSTLNEALMIEAGAPIFSAGKCVGVVLIGQMLNSYYYARPGGNPLQTSLVAEIRQKLYPEAEAGAGALIALGDTIIASSMLNPSATEPLLNGRRHDPALAVETLRAGPRSYTIAWQPLKSLDGSVIASLGVAVPSSEIEGKVTALRTKVAVIASLAVLAAAVSGFIFGRALSSRIGALARAVRSMSVGELSLAVRTRPAVCNTYEARSLMRRVLLWLRQDEIDHLADQLDQMRESFKQAIERLRRR